AHEHHGFIWRQYSPASAGHTGVARKYFTETNARRIDGVRKQIRDWRAAGRISPFEERLLIADLLAATNRVANIAGTYGCYLSHWSPQALSLLELTPRPLQGTGLCLSVSQMNVADLEVERDDLVYLDPPYTKRQYAA